MKNQRGIYSLPQAGIWVNKLLKKRIGRDGYIEAHFTTHLYNLPLQLTILASNVWETNMHAIKNTAQMKKVGQVYCTMVSPSSGTWKIEFSTYPCQNISKTLFKNSTILSPSSHNILKTSPILPNVVKHHNSPF